MCVQALLGLAERLGDVRSRGLSHSDIDQLHCYRYCDRSGSQSDDSNDAGVDQSQTGNHTWAFCIAVVIIVIINIFKGQQCFDAVGWAAGRASGL